MLNISDFEVLLTSFTFIYKVSSSVENVESFGIESSYSSFVQGVQFVCEAHILVLQGLV